MKVRIKRIFMLSLVISMILGVCSCAQQKQTQNEVQADSQAPTEAAAEGSAETVVAVSKSIAQLWLLAGGQPAGVTEDALELEGLSPDAVSIGTISEPNLEAILALTPDLVMLADGIPSQETLQENLLVAGIDCQTIDIGSFEDYDAIMKELTGKTGRSDLYDENVSSVAARIQDVISQAKNLTPATYLALRVSATKNKALKNDNFACQIMNDLQMTNIAEDNSALDDLSVEAVVAADPDYLFIIPQGSEDKAMDSYREAFESKPVWQDLTAVREGRVYVLPKDMFQYKPNNLWDEAYAYIYELRKPQ